MLHFHNPGKYGMLLFMVLLISFFGINNTSFGQTGKVCYTSPTKPDIVSASQTWTINQAAQTVTIRTTFAKTFVDNSYGTNSIGWGSKTHTFDNLVGSDHVELNLFDASGSKKMSFKVDYISSSTSAPSKYDCLGVTGGEGRMNLGNVGDVVSATSSLDQNLNTFGYVLTTNSPASDANYTPNPSYPNWIFDVWYEVTVRLAAFGTSGFGRPEIISVHASPSKTGSNTELVTPGPCPDPCKGILDPGVVCNPESKCEPYNPALIDNCRDPKIEVPTTPPPTSGQSCCEITDKPTSITLQYVGGACNTTNNQSGKATCSGPALTGPVTIKVTDGGSKTFFQGTVNQGGTFTMTTNDKFSSDSYVTITGPEGTQNIKFHTSCSQILAVGDQYGTIKLLSMTGPKGTCGSPTPPTTTTSTCFKVDPPTNGTQQGVTYTVTRDANNVHLLSVTGSGIDYVTVKGGTGTSTYLSGPFTNLTAPINPNTGKPYDISNFTICLGTSGPPPATPELEYQWIMSTTDCPQLGAQGTTVIQGATGKTYDPPSTITQTTYYVRLVRVKGCTDPAGWQYGNCVVKEVKNCKSCLGDCVWEDTDGDGIMDIGERGVSNVTVELYECINGQRTSTKISTTTTNSSGKYAFKDLDPNKDYYVRFYPPSGYELCPANQGTDDALDSDADATGRTHCVDLDPGETDNTVDACIKKIQCNIQLNISQKICNNNGTPNNPDDDTYTFVVTVTGTGTSSTWTGSFSNPYLGIAVIGPTAYGTPVTLGPFPAGKFITPNVNPPLTFFNGLDITVAVNDTQTPACATIVVVPSPGPCSNGPCVGQGGDTDGDGICNVIDCAPNDPSLPTTPGTACNDGNPNTSNDRIQADGCSCAGTLTPCDVNISITQKICNNRGTPNNPDDDTYTFVLTVTGSGTSATWSGGYSNPYLGAFGIGATPYGTPITLGPFPAGKFVATNVFPNITFLNGLDISINVNDSQKPNCSESVLVPSTGPCSTGLCVGRGGDADGDGVCKDEDCDDLNPGVGARRPVGSACNDGNPNTTNDRILADGCSCAGTPACNLAATFTVRNGCLTESFLIFADANDPYFPPNNPKYTYSYDIQPANTVSGLFTVDPRSVTVTFNAAGVKTATVTITDPSIPNCQIVKQTTFTVTDCSPCVNRGGDDDRDGVCKLDDCDDLNPGVGAKKPVGSVCDDGNPTTTNDIIQADGCTCRGTTSNVNNKIGDYVWKDLDSDGVQDAGEPGIPGVYVILYTSTGAYVDLKVTDALGNYCFINVPPGNYKIKFANPGGYFVSPKDAGGNDATDSDMDDTGCTAVFTVTSTTFNLTIDGGFTTKAPPPPPSCVLTTVVTNIICNNNGTPNDPTDDTFTFTIVVGGTGFNNWGWDADGKVMQPYNQPVTMGPYPIAGGTRTIVISDHDDPGNCRTTVNVTPPAPCSAGTDPCATRGGDADRDGVCKLDDCDDNNANVGAKRQPGTSCNDNNPNTVNDQIQADGCTCAGTPTTSGCNVTVSVSGSTVTVSGLTDPIVSVKILNSGWTAIFQCDPWSTPCGATVTHTVPAAGTYYVSIQTYTAGWSRICDKFETVQITGGCTDADRDGVCVPDDCNDNNPNIGRKQAAGTSCNDGNPNTTNDRIQADGCTCVGTPIELCIIAAHVDNILCNNNNTPSNPADDTYSFTVTVARTGGCNSTTWSGGGKTGNSYNTAINYGPYLISGGNTTFVITNSDGVSATVTAIAPAPCSSQGTCSPLTNGGTIGNAQSGCGPFDPAPLTNITFPSGGSGTIEYMWLKSTTGCPTNLTQGIPGAYSASYDPPALTQTTWFIRCARRAGCIDWTIGESNCIKIEVTSCCNGNMVTNNGFENNLVGWSNWGNTAITTTAASGSKAAKIGTGEGGFGQYGTHLTANPGERVTISFKAKKEGTTSWTGAGVDFLDANWNEIAGSELSLTITSTGYLEVTGSKVAPTGTKYVGVWFWKSGAAGYLYVDDVCLSKSANIGQRASKILTFDAQNSKGIVQLNWTNNTGSTVNKFIIERSADGVDFETIVEKGPSNTDDRATFYQDVDHQPLSGDNYYRLKVAYLDGSFEYGETRLVTIADLGSFVLYPNPATEHVNVSLKDFAGKTVVIQIFNQLGVKVKEVKLDEVTEGTHEIDLAGFSNGVYTFWIFNEGGKPVGKKLIVERLY